MKYRLLAVLACVILLWVGITPALAVEQTLPTVTIRYYEEGPWYPLLAPNDMTLTAEALPASITGVDEENQRWEIPVYWDMEEHQTEISSFQDFTLHASPTDTLVGPKDTTYQIRTGGPAAELFNLPIYYFQRGPIGTDSRLSGLTGSYAPWRGQLTLSYNKIGTLEAAPPDADQVLIQSSTDLEHWETVLDVTGEVGGRFDVAVSAERTETVYYRVWVEGGPQAGASTEYVVMEANVELPKVHTVTLEEDLVVGAGEQVTYQTVAENLLDTPENGLYPGELTIQVNGQIVVESGGSLKIGTFSSGGPEAHPVLRGALSPDGLILVEPGGVLELDGVTLELEGQEGYAIRQEDGAVIRLFNTDLDSALVQWGAAVIDNRNFTLQDVWLEAETPLTEGLLPREAEVRVLDRGVSRPSVFPIRWNLGEDAGRTEGETVLTGVFVDGSGALMSTLVPLQVAVRWYAPQELPVIETSWIGDATPAARLQFSSFPDQAAEIWGEWSEDGGATWTRWDQCQFKENNWGPYCVFDAPDSTPRLYRVAAVSADGTEHWASEGVLLPDQDTVPEDPDGNRGGSTGVVRPNRRPEPEKTPDTAPTPPSSSKPEASPHPPAPPEPPGSPELTPEPEETPAMAPSALSQQGQESTEVQSPLPETGATPEQHQSLLPASTEPIQAPPQTSESERSDTSTPQPETPTPSVPANAESTKLFPPGSVQTALAAAGLVICVLAGFGLTWSRLFKKKQ